MVTECLARKGGGTEDQVNQVHDRLRVPKSARSLQLSHSVANNMSCKGHGLLTCLSAWPQVAYQDSFDSSTNATLSTPRLLSPFVRSLRLNAANPYDCRTVGWVLSLALLEVDPVLSINLWTIVVFALAVALPPAVVFLFLCVESLLCSTTSERRCCVGFWVAALIGCALRMVVCCVGRKSASKAES